MSGTETVLYLVVVPAAIVLIVGGLAFVGGSRRDIRYRPGRPYQVAPVWYLANHRRDGGESGSRQALTGGVKRPELTARGDGSRRPGAGDGEQVAAAKGATGGASDRW